MWRRYLRGVAEGENEAARTVKVRAGNREATAGYGPNIARESSIFVRR
jgi:hypothetical protein